MVFAECRAKRKANGGFQSCLECNARGSSKCSFVKVRRDSPEKMKAVMVSLLYSPLSDSSVLIMAFPSFDLQVEVASALKSQAAAAPTKAQREEFLRLQRKLRRSAGLSAADSDADSSMGEETSESE